MTSSLLLMTYPEKLSIMLTKDQLKNVINDNGSRAVNQYAKKQAEEAFQYWNTDANTLYRLLYSKSGDKFKQLFTNDQMVFDYLEKYHNIKYSLGALVMMILRGTDYNKRQTNRILHRSPTFKFWSKPEVSPAGQNSIFVNWDQVYMTTDFEPDNAKTHGELYLDDLIMKMK